MVEQQWAMVERQEAHLDVVGFEPHYPCLSSEMTLVTRSLISGVASAVIVPGYIFTLHELNPSLQCRVHSSGVRS